MKKLYITVGVPASGKSTWTKERLDENTVEINRDDIRFNDVLPGSDWKTYKFTKSREKEVSAVAFQKFNDAVSLNKDIIISDTNLKKSLRDAWINRAKEVGYDVEIVEFPLSLEEAWARNEARENGVPHHRVYAMYKLWEEYIGRKKYIPDESLQKAILIDIDGTVAQQGGRDPFDWDKVDQDMPRHMIIDLILSYQSNHPNTHFIFITGRETTCRYKTLCWLADNFNQHVLGITLFMRQEEDTRKEAVVKEEIFWNNIDKNHNIIAVFDSRPSSCRLWHSLEIPNVICVADQFKEY